jgi:hypothetical protein
MAYFAKIDENNKVTKVHLISNDASATEADGVAECIRLFGEGTYKQSSYNTNSGIHYDFTQDPPVQSEDQSRAFRKNHASKGYTYDSTRDAFIPPKPLGFDSWVLDEFSCQWKAPIDPPSGPDDDDSWHADQSNGPKFHAWDEENQQWVESSTDSLK